MKQQALNFSMETVLDLDGYRMKCMVLNAIAELSPNKPLPLDANVRIVVEVPVQGSNPPPDTF